MKKYIHQVDIDADYQQIEAMSTINPKMCDNSGILIEIEQRDEGPIPHMHVYHDRTRNKRKCSYIRLDKAEYSTHHKAPSPKLPKKAKQEFLKIMTSPWTKQIHTSPDGTMRVATGYEAAVDIWVDTWERENDYSKFTLDEHGDPIMPDYSQL